MTKAFEISAGIFSLLAILFYKLNHTLPFVISTIIACLLFLWALISHIKTIKSVPKGDICPKCNKPTFFPDSLTPSTTDPRLQHFFGYSTVFLCKSCGFNESKLITKR